MTSCAQDACIRQCKFERVGGFFTALAVRETIVAVPDVVTSGTGACESSLFDRLVSGHGVPLQRFSTEQVLECRYPSKTLRFNIANRFLTTAGWFSEVLWLNFMIKDNTKKHIKIPPNLGSAALRLL